MLPEPGTVKGLISAAFDTIDHNILLKRLSTWFGFTDMTLLWIQFYIFLLALSPSKHLKHHPNHALSPVVFRKVQFLGPYTFHPLHYSTQFTHQKKHPQ